MSAMLEDLLGYLIGALEADEHEACCQALQADLELQRQIERLRDALLPLTLCQELIEAPVGLAARTWLVIQETIVQSTDIAAADEE